MLTGIVDTTHHTISKSGRGFSLNGRDKAAILVDCSAPITNVQGLSLLDAVKKIVTPLGIKEVQLKAEKNPTLSKVDIDVGESAWEAIMRCANSAGLHCWFDPKGVLIVGGADYAQPPVATLYCVKESGIAVKITLLMQHFLMMCRKAIRRSLFLLKNTAKILIMPSTILNGCIKMRKWSFINRKLSCWAMWRTSKP